MKHKFEIGQRIAVLDDDLEGLVIGFKQDLIIIETTEGFELSFNASSLIPLPTEGLKNIFQHHSLHGVLSEKEIEKKRKTEPVKKSKKEEVVMEVDLHIEKLVPNKRGMTNYDILNLQLETAKRQLQFALQKRIPKVVFIHGVGEGVLKAELDYLLGRYEYLTFQDANYQKYGLGATEVYFIQKML
uniref:Smr/MutS family protein n=1 Tax=Flavobacterium sp. TaxID=239 RepID=UPI00404942F6